MVATISMISSGIRRDDSLVAAVDTATATTGEADYWKHLKMAFVN